MKKKEFGGIVTVPYKERPDAIEVEICGIPQWKQDVFQLVAELTKYRLRNKITQRELAEKLNVKQSVIARFENHGRYPTVEFLYKIAEGLGIGLGISIKDVPTHEASMESYKEGLSKAHSSALAGSKEKAPKKVAN